MRNGLLLQGKRIEDVKLVNTGGGAAALACLDLLVSMGLKRENVTICDIGGVVHSGRNDLDPYRARYAQVTDARTLEEVLPGADVFLGLSAPRVLKPEWWKYLGPEPLVLAL
ncbi:MAG: NADP-dependent malic enzyme, partial [Blastomonas sp.]|nr:NADP-dependent malic enzyme [Blastomonas sp.]